MMSIKLSMQNELYPKQIDKHFWASLEFMYAFVWRLFDLYQHDLHVKINYEFYAVRQMDKRLSTSIYEMSLFLVKLGILDRKKNTHTQLWPQKNAVSGMHVMRTCTHIHVIHSMRMACQMNYITTIEPANEHCGCFLSTNEGVGRRLINNNWPEQQQPKLFEFTDLFSAMTIVVWIFQHYLIIYAIKKWNNHHCNYRKTTGKNPFHKCMYHTQMMVTKWVAKHLAKWKCRRDKRQ